MASTGMHNQQAKGAARLGIRRVLRTRKIRRENASLLAMLAVIISLAVAGILMQSGRAMIQEERVLDCPVAADGSVAHTHNEDCYDAEGRLVCPLPEVELHVHDDSCYTEDRTLVCGLQEGEGAHTHSDACYDADGNLTCGLEESAGHVHSDDCYEVTRTLTCGKNEVTEEHEHGPGCFRTVVVDDGMDAEEAETTGEETQPQLEVEGSEEVTESEMSESEGTAETVMSQEAQTFQHQFVNDKNEVQIKVNVEAPEGSLPEGTTMKVEWIDPKTVDQELVQQAIDAQAAAKKDVEPGKLLDLQAVDITFLDAEGNEVEPAKPVTVTLTSALANTSEQAVVVHVESEREARERAEAAGERTYEVEAQALDQLTDRELDKREMALANDQLAFDASQFSTYIIATTSLRHEMKSSDGKTVTVTVDAPAEAGIPQDAVIRVQEIGAGTDQYQDYATRANEAIGVDEASVALARFFDIKIEDAQGQEIQPQAPVNVKIELADAAQIEGDNPEANVVHFAQDAEGKAEETPEVLGATEKAGTTTFEAAGFSVYGVVYTVDFHYEVDGQVYELSLQGGDAVSLTELLPALGAVEPEKVGSFVAGIENVEFSDTNLVAVAHMGEEMTVGALRQQNNLPAEYSSELTEEQIAAMEAKVLQSGDWVLLSLKPFDTEETLTITMKNGEVFTIKVTDAQLHTYVISDSGDAYEVIVTYDESAGIPKGAELVVKELQSDSKEFAENIDLVNKELKSKDESEVANPVQFDISIVADGVEVEPRKGSIVRVEIRLAKSMFEEADTWEGSTSEGDSYQYQEEGEESKDTNDGAGLFLYNGEVIKTEKDELTGCRIAHISRDGSAEIIDGVESSSTDDKLVMQFETESFSDYLFDGASGTGLNNLPNTIYVGDEIYMWNQADYWVTNIGSVVLETKHNNGWDPDGYGPASADSSNYKTVTALAPGTFRIVHKNDWNNGNPYRNYKEITVLPARTGTNPPATIDTINNADIGLTLNLFDYDLDNYLDDYFNGSSHYDNTCIADFAEHGINAGNALKFWGSGIGNNYGSLNQYVEHGVTSIVNTNLNASGYPVLSSNSGGSGNRDLSYLFTPSNGTDKTAYTNVDGLFKKENDYYIYDSNANYAWYNPSTNRFEVYNSTYEQKSRSDGGEQATQLTDKAIGFFPFHKWDSEYDLYVNWNKNLNHHFGMSMSVPFSMPKDPKAVVDTNGDPIIFEFSGDDDLWVFIDGKLVMDIGGIHQPTSGTINFQTGTVTVNNQTQMNSYAFNRRFPDLYDGKQHTLQVFYIERGGCDSNCMIKFNLTQYGDIHFDKVDKDTPSDKLAGAVFGIYKDEACTQPLMENLKNGTSRAYVAESDANGRVQFSDIPIGTYYLKELHAPEGYPLDDTVHTVQVYVDQTTGQVKVKVTVDGEDVEEGVRILNGKPAPIRLVLQKKWQDEVGSAITAPEGATATFEIKRIRNYETYTEQTIQGEEKVSHLTVGWIHGGQAHVRGEYDLIAGSTANISWGYVSGYTGTPAYEENGIRHDKDSVSTNVYSEALTMPAAGQSVTFYIVDESENGEAITNINVAGSQFYGNSGGGVIHNFTNHTEPDPIFSYDGDHVSNNQVELPINSNTWSYIFDNLPTFGRGRVDGVDHDVSFNYSYYLEEISNNSPEGTTVVYTDSFGNEINASTDAETSTSGTQTIINRVPTGYLRIDKSVTYNGVSPVPEGKRADLAGTYTFKVYTDSNCSKPYKVLEGEAPNQHEVDLQLTVTIDNDGAAKSSDTVKIPVGEYWIEEQTPSQTGVTPDENRIKVTVSADQTTQSPAVASFVNNKDESDNPDELAIELEKTFTGLPNSAKIPGDFQAVLTYTNNGSPVTVNLTGSTQGHVTCTKSDDGMTWHWRITRIPVDATDFSVYEDGFDIEGYGRVSKINGVEVQDPRNPQAVTVLIPTITMTNITDQYTTTDNNKVFSVTDNQILLVRMTNHATVIVSQKSLSLATRQAIEKMIRDNGGKIPGDDGANAQWVTNFVYFSHEIQGDSFSYGGRTIYFNGNNVMIPHKSSSHEVRVDIGYTSTSAENSFTLENSYAEIPTEVDVLKVEKGNETTTHLPGAVFELRKLEDVAPITPGDMLTYVKDSNEQVIVTSKTTGDDGKLTFSNLTYGVYEIREVTPPAGYIQTEDVAIYLRVDGGAITYLQKGSGKPSEWTEAPNSTADATVYYLAAQSAVVNNPDTPEDESAAAANATFRVSNTPGQALPNAGGSGTLFATLAGAAMIAAGALYLAASRRRAWAEARAASPRRNGRV